MPISLKMACRCYAEELRFSAPHRVARRHRGLRDGAARAFCRARTWHIESPTCDARRPELLDHAVDADPRDVSIMTRS